MTPSFCSYWGSMHQSDRPLYDDLDQLWPQAWLSPRNIAAIKNAMFAPLQQPAKATENSTDKERGRNKTNTPDPEEDPNSVYVPVS